MSITGKRAEFGDPQDSFSAATFRKALKGFEIGGLPYMEVQFQLKRLLAGVSRRELREVLRRSKSIEPLPEYACREVRRLLDEANEQDATLQTDPEEVIEHERESDPAALAAELQVTRDALESERVRVREAEEALSERIVAEEAVRSRLDMTLRESERSHGELRAARNSIASRDKVTAQMRQALDERDAQLAAMRREHAELAAALDLRSTAAGEQLDADLQALRGQAAAAAAELAASRDAVEKERRKRQEIERALNESNTQSVAARESLASKDKAFTEMRQTLAERDAQLAAMHLEQAELAQALDSRTTAGQQLDADLQASRAQTAAAAGELAASRDAADKERRKRQEIERALTESNSLGSAARESLASKDKAFTDMRQTLAERDAQLVALQRELQAALQASEENLRAAQRRVVGANTELDGLRSQVANLQASLRDNNALIEKLGASVRSEAERATHWHAAAQQRESEAAVIAARVEALPPVEVLPRAQTAQASAALAKFLSAVRGWRWNIRTAPRPLWIGAAIVLLATVIWSAAHRLSPVPSSPAAPDAVMIQPASGVLAESVEPESAPTENVSAIEAPPHAATTPAAGKPVTAGGKLNTDFQRCRAGGIDACYDAVRYRPSDPSLLSALGDALLRAKRPADALRTYQRVAILAPNMPGVVAKISAIEAKLSAKHASGNASTHAADTRH
jgi:hypothetical protein